MNPRRLNALSTEDEFLEEEIPQEDGADVDIDSMEEIEDVNALYNSSSTVDKDSTPTDARTLRKGKLVLILMTRLSVSAYWMLLSSDLRS